VPILSFPSFSFFIEGFCDNHKEYVDAVNFLFRLTPLILGELGEISLPVIPTPLI
jgi:hypothetical protein